MNSRYMYIRGYVFISLACVKEMLKMTDASLEAHVIKIGDILDSKLLFIF